MGADWIKMRTDLYRDPKVSLMADHLMCDDSELTRYVTRYNERYMSVTRNVMRNVVIGALVSVWGVMRHQGKRYENDLHCEGATLSVIDDISDLPGFGAAMLAAGWLVKTESGLEFPKFFESHNASVKGRESLTNAERQRQYRERVKAQKSLQTLQESNDNVTTDVTTRCVTSNGKNALEIEKEIDINTTPIPPSGGTKKSKREGKPALSFSGWVDANRGSGKKLIPEDHSVFEYANRIGLPDQFLRMQWTFFKDRYSTKQKRYKDWPAVFKNSVEGNWFRLWYMDANGEYVLTTQGLQAQKAFEGGN